MFDLTGKVALVAGGAGYLGAPVCKGLAEHGAKVAIADIDRDRLDTAANDVAAVSSEQNVTDIRFDINDEASIKQAIARTVEQFGRLDIAVIATFVHAGPTVEQITPEGFDAAMHANATGAFLMARAAAGAMTDGGCIIMYASMYAVVAPVPHIYERPRQNPNPIEYGAAKAAIVQMTKYLAAHYGRRNIRVNAVMPGAFPWPSQQEDFPEFTRKACERTMLGRMGRREETAGAVVFLASDEASYITAHLLKIDGGWTEW